MVRDNSAFEGLSVRTPYCTRCHYPTRDEWSTVIAGREECCRCWWQGKEGNDEEESSIMQHEYKVVVTSIPSTAAQSYFLLLFLHSMLVMGRSGGQRQCMSMNEVESGTKVK